MNPKYPIYIPSKGRYNSRHTVKALDLMKVPYKVVVEPSEYKNYSQVVDPSKILKLPFDNMLLIGSRNWIKEHSMNLGHSKHWQLDDNIAAFNRLNNNLQVKVTSGTIFKCAEDFCDRYENIAFAGFQYDFFAKAKTIMRPYNLNTRIYSCTLVDNSFDYKWRSVYNDDTDVCLQALKDGKCTVLFNAFLQEKATTMTISGGNTEQLYLVDDGRLKMAEALAELHPDVCKVSWKFNRWQHHVNYKRFKVNKLIRKPDFDFKPVVNNYGMILINKK
jgi:hypothetical protein